MKHSFAFAVTSIVAAWVGGGLLVAADEPFVYEGPTVTNRADGIRWRVSPMNDVRIRAGSALDLSLLTGESQAGEWGNARPFSDGSLRFERKPDEKVRLLGTVLGWWDIEPVFYSGVVDRVGRHAAIDELALEIKRMGLNFVRLLGLTDNTAWDVWQNNYEQTMPEEKQDALDYLVYSCAREGIYVFVDLASTSLRARHLSKDSLVYKYGTMLKDESFWVAWKKCAEDTLNHVNPYTGKAWKSDPAIVGYMQYNEQATGAKLATESYWNIMPESLRDLFMTGWRSWAAENTPSVTPVSPPPAFYLNDAGRSAHAYLSHLFGERALDYDTVLAEIGAQGLNTAYNSDVDFGACAARWQASDAVPYNVHHGHPQGDAPHPGSRVSQDSVIELCGQGRGFCSCNLIRFLDRPFVITECSHAYWNKTRYENVVLQAAYSAFSGYSGLLWHSGAADLAAEGDWPRGCVDTFRLSGSPIGRAQVFLSTLLFRRGDVRESPHRVNIEVPVAYLRANTQSAPNSSQARISLLTRCGLSFPELPRPAGVTAPVEADVTYAPGYGDEIEDGYWVSHVIGTDMSTFDMEACVSRFREKGILSQANRTSPKDGIYESDTEELYLASADRVFVVKTPLTEAVCAPSGTVCRVGRMALEGLTEDASVALTSVDGLPLGESGRMVFVFATRESNSDEIHSADETVKVTERGYPALLHVGRVVVSYRTDHPERYRLYLLDYSGARKEELPVAASGDALSFSLDTAATVCSPTPFFELADVTRIPEPMPERDSDGNLVFAVGEGQYRTFSAAITNEQDRSVGVVKRGKGTLRIAGTGNTFTGTIRVEEGTLAMPATAHAGDGMDRPALTVADGATFVSDGPNSPNQWANLPFRSLELSGDGVDGLGSFVRTNDTTGLRSENLSVSLSGDTTVNVASQWNPGAVRLNGYRLTKIGKGMLDGFNATYSADGRGGCGSVHIAEGSYLNQYAYNLNGGGPDNVFELSGGSTYRLYHYIYGKSLWTMNVGGAATLHAYCGSAGEPAVWGGPVSISGGDLILHHNGEGHGLVIEKGVTSTGSKGIVLEDNARTEFCGDVDLGEGTLQTRDYRCGDVTFRKSFSSGGVSLSTDPSTTNSPLFRFCGPLMVRGDFIVAGGVRTEFEGDVRFDGADRVELPGVLGSNDKTQVERYEVVDVGCFRHTADVLLNGSQYSSSPTVFSMANSLWDGGGSYFVVGSNYCPALLELWDCVFSNKLYVGGVSASQWGGPAAVYQHGGEVCAKGGLVMNLQPGTVAYIKHGGLFDNDGRDMNFGGNGFASLYLLEGGTNEFGGSVKLRPGGAYSQSYGNVFYQDGGLSACYGFYFENGKDGETALLALDNGAVLKTTGYRGEFGIPATVDMCAILSAGNGGKLVTSRVCRNENCARTESSAARWYWTFDGGVLCPTRAGNWTESAGRGPDAAFVQSGGVIIDTSELGDDEALTLSVPFVTPTGHVIGSVDLPTDPEFSSECYIAPPHVRIEGSGVGAAAIAMLDERRHCVSSIRVVAVGSGYGAGTRVQIESQAHGRWYDCPFRLDIPARGAGLVKRGECTLRLEDLEAFADPIAVEAGAIDLAATGRIDLPVLRLDAGTTVKGLSEAGLRVTERLVLSSPANGFATIEGDLLLADGLIVEIPEEIKLGGGERTSILRVSGKIVCEGAVIRKRVGGWKMVISDSEVVLVPKEGDLLFVR